MKFIVRRSDLLRELLLINGVVGHKSSIAALTHMLIRAGERLSLYGTEIDLALTTSRCNARILEPGESTVHASTFLALVQAIPETDITVQSDEKSITVSAERFTSTLQSLPVDHYPTIPAVSGEQAVLSRAILREAVQKVFTRTNGPHYIGGALLELQGGVFCVMSTDGLRMSIVKSPYLGRDSKVLVPQKTIEELKLLLEEGDDDVTFQQDGNHLFFTVDGRVLFSTIIDGEFPDLSRITNVQHTHSVEFEREKLLGAVTRVGIVGDATKALKFSLSSGRVTIRAGAAGRAEEILLVDGRDSGEMCFNIDHLTGFLNSTGADGVSMSWNDAESPVFWRPTNTPEFDYLYVLAPMRAT